MPIFCINLEDCQDSDLSCRYNATQWMCDPDNDTPENSGNFLSKCPKSCLENGFNHGQCSPKRKYSYIKYLENNFFGNISD